MKIGLLGRKIGMTRVYDDKGRATAVTVIEAGGNTPLQVKTAETDGYSAVQVGFHTQKESRVNKSVLGVFKKHNSEPKKLVKEFRLPDGTSFQGEIDLSVNQFAAGDQVDVIGQSKGKGFQGGVKRYHFKGQHMTHGYMTHRRPLSSGATGPQRVFKGTRRPGRMGGDTVTQKGLKVVKVDAERNLILVSGSVPGPNGTEVTINKVAA